MENIFKYISAAILAVGMAGCSDFLSEDGAPKMNYDYYSTDQGVDAAIDAAYSYMRYGCGGERMSVLTEMGTDLFQAGSDGGNKAAYNAYGSQLNAENGVMTGLWNNHYAAISDCNIAIGQIENSSTMTDSKKRTSLGEMHFLRAFFYFDLVQQFGRIPLETEGSFEVRTSFSRSSVSDVYNQIINDLRMAIDYLPEEPSMKGKACVYSASHLLAKVYLTRGSAVSDQRGQKSTDIDSVLYYSKKVIESNKYKLETDFADLWDINNQGNDEVIFSVQFTTNLIFNGNGNWHHLFWTPKYDSEPGMQRNIEYGRPYARHRPTEKTLLKLFDRKNDSRFYKSFRWAFICNYEATIPKWAELSANGSVYFTPDASKGQVAGQPKFALGDTATFFSVEVTGLDAASNEYKAHIAKEHYNYYAYEGHTLQKYPQLIKHMAPNRPSLAETSSSREWVRMRLAETYLLAAEAAGRLGDYDAAAEYINVLRKRAAWHDGEEKCLQYWKFEGGEYGNTESTYDEIKVTSEELRNSDFVTFILDERGRELLGEIMRWEDLVRTERFYDMVKEFNPEATGLKPYHKLRPIPQTHIDRLSPAGEISEEQNEGYY